MAPSQTVRAPDARDAKTALILDTARALFLERGYAETSMDQVSHSAKISKTTLYTRFPSKEALFGAVVLRECELTGIVFDPEELIRLPLEVGLARVARGLMEIECSPARRRAEQILTAEASRFPEIVRIFLEAGPHRFHSGLIRFLKLAGERGLAHVEDAETTANAFAAMCSGVFCDEWRMGLAPDPNPEERDKLAQIMARLFIRGVHV